MRFIWLVAACLSVAAALPSGPRDDMEADDEPYYSEFEPGLDLVAEESGGAVPVVVAAPDYVDLPPPVSQAEKERSLMLVMPLTASNDTALEDLYTKAPVTQIVDTTTTPMPPTTTQKVGTTLVVTPTPQRKLPPVETITLPPPTISPDIKDLLASIGLFPDVAEPMPEQASSFPFKSAADSFSPEIRELMSQYGVLPPNLPVQPTVDTASFAKFKPIPDRLNINDEMQDFLSQFGLVEGRQPSSRQLTTPTPDVQPSEDFKIRAKESDGVTTDAPTAVPTLHPDSMSNEMKKVMFELGLAPHLTLDDIQEDDRHPAVPLQSNETPGVDTTLFEDRSSANHEFVFNPTDAAPLNDTMEEKLQKILSTFKYLDNSSHSPEVVEEQLQQATKLFAKYRKGLAASGGPDPLATEELLLGLEEAHNDLYKRQNNETSTSKSTTTTSTTTEAAEEVTKEVEESGSKEEQGGPSIADLESSFGGSGDEVADESLPPPKPNGFYFLLDLNTFLNVGEDDKGVNLRLAPRLGNSKNFLPITVP